ncbi:MAG TPA: rRNA maturation RNase YbeY [Dehalococcoidia bacterium]|nr:rRNA maturation RNase YbeY [Dehalococcoidia bacterium]
MPYDVTADLDGPARGRIEPATYVALIESVLAAEGIEDGALTLLFAGDELLWRLNREHRDVDAPTDVLSFADDDDEPMPTDAGESTYIGDIAVSIEMAARQAGDAGLTVEEELRHLVVHGVLHLLGYDHESDDDDAKMSAREEAVLGPQIHAGGGHDSHA